MILAGCSSAPVKQQYLEGLWLKNNQDGSSEGFYLGPQGELQFYNIYTWLGDSWSVDDSTLLWLSFSDEQPVAELSELPYSLNSQQLIIDGESYFQGHYSSRPFVSICGQINLVAGNTIERMSLNITRNDDNDNDNETTLLVRKVLSKPLGTSFYNLALATADINSVNDYKLTINVTDSEQQKKSTTIALQLDNDACYPAIEL
jgi:hypothetical protein